METTIDHAGRLILPKPLREAIGLDPGTRVRFGVRDGRITIEPVPRNVSLERRGPVVAAVTRGERRVLTAEEVEATIIGVRSGASPGDDHLGYPRGG